MTFVKLALLHEAGQDFRQIMKRLQQYKDQSDAVLSSLGHMPEYESVMFKLRRLEEEMDEEKAGLINMERALEEISDCYIQAERDIQEYGFQLSQLARKKSGDL